jgi:hypothetical protein
MSKRLLIDLTQDDDISDGANKRLKSESWFDSLLDEYSETWTLLQSVQLIINAIHNNSSFLGNPVFEESMTLVPVSSIELVQRNNTCLDEINCGIGFQISIARKNKFCHMIRLHNHSESNELTWCIEQHDTKQTIMNLLNQIGDNWNLLNQIGDNWNLLNQIGDNWNLLKQIGDDNWNLLKQRNLLEQRNLLKQRNLLEQRNLYYLPSLVDFTFDQLQQCSSDYPIHSDHLGFNQIIVPILEKRNLFHVIPIISSFLGICHKELLPHIFHRYKLLEAVRSIINEKEASIEYFDRNPMNIFKQNGEFCTRIGWKVTVQHTSEALVETMMEYLNVSWPQVIPRLAHMLT